MIRCLTFVLLLAFSFPSLCGCEDTGSIGELFSTPQDAADSSLSIGNEAYSTNTPDSAQTIGHEASSTNTADVAIDHVAEAEPVGDDAQQESGPNVGEGNVEIHLRSTTAPVAHDDGLAGQTPIAHSSGLRSLRLYRTSDDPSPLTVFDYGTQSVEASYDDGSDTLVSKVRADTLPSGNFTVARVVQAYTRYRVRSTIHASGYHQPGELSNMQVLSNGSLVNGTVRDAGYFEYVFTAYGQPYPMTGNNAPIPEFLGTGGFRVVFENGELAYYFPISLLIDSQVTSVVRVILLVNMHESFRWEDRDLPYYQTAVFDSSPIQSELESVLRFGGNSFQLQLE